jgi:polyisoprenoid-binding protein YceI
MSSAVLTRPESTEASSAATPATTWAIDASHSHVEFAVKHLMISTVKGRFAAVEGTIVLDEANPAASYVDVKIPAASIDTREPQRDAHLRSADFLDAENYPYLTFVSRRVEPKDGGEFIAEGDLTIRGVTKPVVLDGEFLGSTKTPFGTTVAAFSAKTKLNRKDFGLNWNAALETGGVLVGDEVKINLEVEAIQQVEAAQQAA